MNPARSEPLDDSNFLVAAQTAFTGTAAARCQPAAPCICGAMDLSKCFGRFPQTETWRIGPPTIWTSCRSNGKRCKTRLGASKQYHRGLKQRCGVEKC